jgi:hypothetical protein
MHEEIKKFLLTGEISDKDIVKTKARLVEAQEAVMREEGYVPDLDKDPQFTMSYLPELSKFTFTLTVYGIYVGKDKAWTTGGVMGGKPIMKSTQPIK